MTITYTIPGATLLNQLSPTTLDGLPNNDANDDCVPTSIAEGLHILTGQRFDGDELKDAVYGANFVGFQSAARYVAYCAAHGVTLAAHNGSQSDLIAEIHTQVSAGHPVVVTMPSQWGTAPSDPVHPSGYTHVGVAVGVGPGEIRVMNPWHGFWQDESDAWWQARLCYGQVWPMVKSGGGTGAPTGGTAMWHQVSAGVMADSHGVETRYAMAAYLAAHTDTPDVVSGCGGETYISAKTSILPLAGAPGALVYQKSDNAVHTDQAGIVLWEQHQALAAAQAADAQAQSQLAQAQQQASAAEAKAQQDAATIGAQSGQIATLTQQTQQQAAQIATLKAQLASAQQATPVPVPAPVPTPTPAPTTPADAAALLVTLIYAEAEATFKAASSAPAAATPAAATPAAS